MVRADANPLLGTWKLKSYVVISNGGETSLPYGEHPTGYLSYSADGRMQVIGTGSGRIVPRGAVATDEELVELQTTMFANAGTYSVEQNRVTHHVDVSWNEVWNGTDQVRSYEVNGDALVITTRLADPASGVEASYIVVWEKVRRTTGAC